MPRLVDITDQRFGHLVALTYAPNWQMWNCICDCGNKTRATSSNLRYGRTQSCGCFRIEATSKRRRTHGESHKTPEWRAWVNMKKRCFEATSKDWKNWGGRGITVCERWMKYENFLADMGRRTSLKHQLDRIDNDGNYEPRNCRWATQKEQMKTRRRIGPFWDLAKRRIAAEKGRRTRWG